MTDPILPPAPRKRRRRSPSFSPHLFVYFLVLILQFIGLILLLVLRPDMNPIIILAVAGSLLVGAGAVILYRRSRDRLEQQRQFKILQEKQFSDEIINGLPGIFFMHDSGGRLLRWNTRYEKMTGLSATEMSSRRMMDLVAPAEKEAVSKLLREVEATGKAEAEITFLTREQKQVPFYITALTLPLGEKSYLIGFGIDVSEFKRMMEAHRVLVDNSVQGLAIYQKGRIVFANPAYAKLLGYSVNELYSLNEAEVTNLIFGDDRPMVNLHLQSALSGDEIAPRYETRVLCKDGSIRWLEVTMNIINYQSQPATQWAAVDITERKLMEVDQARLIWELETKNAELERFTYTVSHDLKSPLITIRGFLGFLEKDVALNNRARMRADIQRITEATDKMQRLLSDLLMLSRVGRVTSPMEDVPFESIVRDAEARASGQIRARGVHVTVAAQMPIVRVDRERVVEVVQNLLDNAVKFMGNQVQPKIEVGFAGSAQDNKAVFFVGDNGMGIDKQFHERIFGLFNKLNPDSDGTGIGLALVKRIIELHDGRIWLESEPGKGSTFYFSLPLPETNGTG